MGAPTGIPHLRDGGPKARYQPRTVTGSNRSAVVENCGAGRADQRLPRSVIRQLLCHYAGQMIDPARFVFTTLSRACSFLSNYGEREHGYAPSANAPSDAHVEIRFTVDDKARADQIVGELLSRRLVACGQLIGPMTSRYWWAGKLQRSEEWLVLLKTRSGLTERVSDVIVEHHPYEIPEIVAIPIVAGLADYLHWVDDVTGVSTGHQTATGDSTRGSADRVDEVERSGTTSTASNGADGTTDEER